MTTILHGQPVMWRGGWSLASDVNVKARTVTLIGHDGSRAYDVDFDEIEPIDITPHETVSPAPREAAADAAYGEEALASAIRDWADLLGRAERTFADGSRAAPDSASVSVGRVIVRAVASAMWHTAEAARMVHASKPKPKAEPSCKRTETEREVAEAYGMDRGPERRST